MKNKIGSYSNQSSMFLMWGQTERTQTQPRDITCIKGPWSWTGHMLQVSASGSAKQWANLTQPPDGLKTSDKGKKTERDIDKGNLNQILPPTIYKSSISKSKVWKFWKIQKIIEHNVSTILGVEKNLFPFNNFSSLSGTFKKHNEAFFFF